jgi:hypothetical protein
MRNLIYHSQYVICTEPMRGLTWYCFVRNPFCCVDLLRVFPPHHTMFSILKSIIVGRTFLGVNENNYSILHCLLSGRCQLCFQQIIRLRHQIGALDCSYVTLLKECLLCITQFMFWFSDYCRLHIPVDARALLVPAIQLTAIALHVSMSLTANASCARVVSSSACRTLPSRR